MKIIADENIPLLQECFGSLGEIVSLPGRSIKAQHVSDADALLVRSVTQVNQKLLADSSLTFVGTATAGVDHIDQPWLASKGVGFANAPGCNATAVSEYVLSALDILVEKYGFNLQGRTFGVVGKGQVGSRLVKTLQRMGLKVLVADPLCEKNEDIEFVPLSQLIQRCDVISLHTPLTIDGPCPTYHMIGPSQLAAMHDGTVLISAGRGPVIDNQALLECLQNGKDLKVVMDVWEHEPAVDLDLLQRVELATPHIAGYSLDGKIAGTFMIYQALCRHFGLTPQVTVAELTPAPPLAGLTFSETVTPEQAIPLAIRAVYDIRRDDAWMRRLLTMDHEDACQAFDQMRKNYPVRREFASLQIHGGKLGGQVKRELANMGFNFSRD